MPSVVHHSATTELVFQTMNELFSDIIPVEKVGQTHIWFTPRDYLIRWTGVEQNLLSLDCRNLRVGSGGYGYTSELPGDGFDPQRLWEWEGIAMEVAEEHAR